MSPKKEHHFTLIMYLARPDKLRKVGKKMKDRPSSVLKLILSDVLLVYLDFSFFPSLAVLEYSGL
jgi:hypothetical protein